MRKAYLYRYRLPLISTGILRDHAAQWREGLIVHLQWQPDQALPNQPLAERLSAHQLPAVQCSADQRSAVHRSVVHRSSAQRKPDQPQPNQLQFNQLQSNQPQKNSPQSILLLPAEGWGEIAPLPGFSNESLEDACQAACQWLSAWCAADALAASAPAAEPLAADPPFPALPAVAFGLSCALAELTHSLPAPISYHTVPLFSAERQPKTPTDSGTSAAAGSAAADTPLAWANCKLAKYKLARQPPAEEARQISQWLSAQPALRLRLDANRGWTLAQAQQFARQLSPAHRQRILFIEEPCHNVAQSCQFASETGIAIAWDESLREQGLALMHKPGVAALIIKPTLTGSLQQVRQLIQAAHQQRLMAVISSSIESSLGLSQLARLALWLTPHTPPGLDTLSLLGGQILRRWQGSSLECLTLQQLQQVFSEQSR